MFIELLAFTLLGIILGTATGLIPGLHVNTITLVLIGFGAGMNPYPLAAALISLAITHTFWDFVPSILLGAPEPSTALSILPGHYMLLEGRGLEAVYLTIIGGIGVILLSSLLFPVIIAAVPVIYRNIQLHIHWILILIAAVMILTETGRKIPAATFTFLLSGILGLIIFNSYILPSGIMLFPVFTGLFGMSTLIVSLNRKTKIPPQEMEIEKPQRKIVFSGIVKGLFSGSVVGTLPGIGAAQAAVLTQEITRKKDYREFLISVGAINTVVALFSLISLYTISKARSGAALAVQQILPDFGFNEIIVLMAVALIAAGISAIVMLKTTKKIVDAIQKINYSIFTAMMMVFLLILTAFLSGLAGMFILFVSTSIGLIAPLTGIKRSSSMGVLMLPLILFYMGIM